MSDKKEYSSEEVQSAISDILRTHDHLSKKDLMKLVNKKLDGAKGIRSIADLQAKSQEVDKAAGGYGGEEIGVVGERDVNDTPDDKATKEDNKSRVKNSKNPTTVGKVMK